jgi:Ni/Co efflux regulator RcnB
VNGHRYERASGPAWKAPKGWQNQRWQRGQRLPVEYRKTVIRDYRAYHLNAPPRGYEYVRVGNDVVLTAVATGLISAIIANAFYN